MKGSNLIQAFIRRRVSLLILLVAFMQSLGAEDRLVVIVKSGDNAYFNQTVKTLIDRVEAHARFRIVNTVTLNATDDLLGDADILITLGSKSARLVANHITDQVVINAYVTEEQFNEFEAVRPRQLALLLDQPLDRYLVFSRELLNLKSLGIISRSSLELDQQQRDRLAELNLTVNQYQLDDPNKELLSTLRRLTRNNDALLMLPDQSIYNRASIKGVLLTTYRGRTPVISYSPGHVKSGALAAIYSSPVDIGRQLADMINRHISGDLDTGSKTVYPGYYSIATNPRVAHSLGLSLPGEDRLRQSIDGLAK